MIIKLSNVDSENIFYFIFLHFSVQFGNWLIQRRETDWKLEKQESLFSSSNFQLKNRYEKQRSISFQNPKENINQKC